jgi:hypothetical protein
LISAAYQAITKYHYIARLPSAIFHKQNNICHGDNS